MVLGGCPRQTCGRGSPRTRCRTCHRRRRSQPQRPCPPRRRARARPCGQRGAPWRSWPCAGSSWTAWRPLWIAGCELENGLKWCEGGGYGRRGGRLLKYPRTIYSVAHAAAPCSHTFGALPTTAPRCAWLAREAALPRAQRAVQRHLSASRAPPASQQEQAGQAPPSRPASPPSKTAMPGRQAAPFATQRAAHRPACQPPLLMPTHTPQPPPLLVGAAGCLVPAPAASSRLHPTQVGRIAPARTEAHGAASIGFWGSQRCMRHGKSQPLALSMCTTSLAQRYC
jgi:hypothetical protein